MQAVRGTPGKMGINESCLGLAARDQQGSQRGAVKWVGTGTQGQNRPSDQLCELWHLWPCLGPGRLLMKSVLNSWSFNHFLSPDWASYCTELTGRHTHGVQTRQQAETHRHADTYIETYTYTPADTHRPAGTQKHTLTLHISLLHFKHTARISSSCSYYATRGIFLRKICHKACPLSLACLTCISRAAPRSGQVQGAWRELTSQRA